MLAEDDWRQLELVDARHAAAIEQELAAIRTIYADHRKGPGFTTVHVRKAIPAPLSIPIATLAFAGPTLPLRLHGHATRIAGGFAAKLEGGWVVYGVAKDGVVSTLGLQPGGGPLPSAVTALPGLVLVDWIAGRTLTA